MKNKANRKVWDHTIKPTRIATLGLSSICSDDIRDILYSSMTDKIEDKVLDVLDISYDSVVAPIDK